MLGSQNVTPRWGAVAILLASAAAAQASWSTTPIVGTPPPRAEHAGAYDLARVRLVTFGGYDPTYTALAATWTFDGVRWSELHAATTPPPRALHAMCYDLARERVVMFGGQRTVLGPYLADTWEWNGRDWRELRPATAPSPRFDHAMGYDIANRRTVLFGGRPTLNAQLGDTWLWDGRDWLLAAVSGPAARGGHAMSGDLGRGRVVLYGGFAGPSFDDTWEWDGASWTQPVVGLRPFGRSNHAMAFDIQRLVTVMQGGTRNGDETWEWDGTAWTQRAAAPVGRIGQVLAYDARLRRTTRTGGAEGSPLGFVADTETYGPPVPGAWVASGASCAGTSTAPVLSAPAGLHPGPMIGRTVHVQVQSAWQHALFVFGWSDRFDGATPLPMDLTPFGMPGCALQVSRDAIVGAVPVHGTATAAIAVPNDPLLVGAVFYVQGLSLDLAANAGGFTTTNRLQAAVGRY